MEKIVLDPASGSRMFYFDKKDPRVMFGDIRTEYHILCDGRKLEINPDINLDFTNLPFEDSSFYVVVFDPPHLIHCGDNAWIGKKYGRLPKDWKLQISAGFKECFRVLKPNGILIFKWNETQVKVSEILALTEVNPLVGHISGKRSNTHWITFLKPPESEGEA